jgi:SP family xylose:H+ symportor-like MFS transporter
MQNKQFLYQITIVATLGGLLFGYDTAVISGAISNLAEYFSLSPAQKGWAASSALVGCIAGAILASYLSISIGRKRGMIVASILFFISALGSGLADNFTIFIIYRIVGGVGVGLASMLAPMYIAEISPASQRGLLVSLYQLAIVTGIIVVYFVNYIIALQGDAQWNLNLGWRWMFASEAIPSLLYFAFLFLVPQSPRWQAMKGYNEKAKNTLNKILHINK